jgi:hypothetical protein
MRQRRRFEVGEQATTGRTVERAAEELLDGFIVALQDFDTDTLCAIADYRDEIAPDGWMQRLIREYVDVWR